MLESFVPGHPRADGPWLGRPQQVASRSDSPADFRLGAGRSRKCSTGIWDPGRSREWLRRNERRAGWRTDRPRLSARGHDRRALRVQRRDVRASTIGRSAAAPDKSSTSRCSSRCSRCSGRSRRNTPRSAVSARGTGVDRRTPVHAGAIPPAMAAGSPSAARRRRWPSAFCAATGSRSSSTIRGSAPMRRASATRRSSTARLVRRLRRGRSPKTSPLSRRIN